MMPNYIVFCCSAAKCLVYWRLSLVYCDTSIIFSTKASQQGRGGKVNHNPTKISIYYNTKHLRYTLPQHLRTDKSFINIWPYEHRNTNSKHSPTNLNYNLQTHQSGSSCTPDRKAIRIYTYTLPFFFIIPTLCRNKLQENTNQRDPIQLLQCRQSNLLVIYTS